MALFNLSSSCRVEWTRFTRLTDLQVSYGGTEVVNIRRRFCSSLDRRLYAVLYSTFSNRLPPIVAPRRSSRHIALHEPVSSSSYRKAILHA